MAYVIGGSLGLRPLLRITADEPKYAICATTHIAYLGAVLHKKKGGAAGGATGGDAAD
jgi:hypothetical protein